MKCKNILLLWLVTILCTFNLLSTPSFGGENSSNGQGPYIPSGPTIPDGGTFIPPPKYNTPPSKPTNNVPENNSLNLELNVTLSIYVEDKDGDFLIVKFYNAETNEIIDSGIFEPNSTAVTLWSNLEYNRRYSWYVEVWDGIACNFSDVFYFTTKKEQTVEKNLPPMFSDPYPKNNANNLTLNLTLSVYVEDPEGNNISVYFYNGDDDTLIGNVVVTSGYRASVSWSGLDYLKTYTWYVYLSDGENTVRSDIYSFTTRAEIHENSAPLKPTNPYPKNNTKDIDNTTTLSVDVNDPDGDELIVYFYNAKEDSIIGIDSIKGSGTANITWSNLRYGEIYSWYVVVSDSEKSVKSDIYFFKTKELKSEEEAKKECWIYGIVFIKDENTTLPAIDVKVCIAKYPSESEIYCGRTNERGEFFTYNLTPGKYKISAIRNLEYKAEALVNVEEGKETPFILTINAERDRMQIERAIFLRDVGGEISIEAKEQSFEFSVISYENITISPVEVVKEKITMVIVSEKVKEGKTIVLTIDENLLDISKPISVTYDGEEVGLAEDIEDVLDPNNDGLNPEYILLKGARSLQIMISIPHFSHHEINIQNIVKAVQINAEIFYILACLVAAALFIGISYIRLRVL